MKYIDEYRNQELVKAIADRLKRISKKEIILMEVCGGHTMAIHRFGLNSLLPPNIRLISGPGCPVCVSSQRFIDTAIACSRVPDSILATYGDLMRVPGTSSSLDNERAKGKDIRVIYSVLEAVEIARQNPEKIIIFPGIGFETTTPATSAAILKAFSERISNFRVLSAHKVMPPVMKALVDEDIKINGFIAPGHVSTVAGTTMYDDLALNYGLGVVVSGFEPSDIMQSVLMLAEQIEKDSPKVEVQYTRVVEKEGNSVALKLMYEVFEYRDDEWRGFGTIPESGLQIKKEYSDFNAENELGQEVPESAEPKGCICGQILRGLKTPSDCRLFGKECRPSDPVGACMVSSEGICSTYYRYRS